MNQEFITGNGLEVYALVEEITTSGRKAKKLFVKI